jgi:DNA helicase HerA-like ATPase
MHVIGRTDGAGPVGALGHYRARDGSAAARVGIDLDRPHLVLVVGKRGTGKSYTMGVLAEELAETPGVSPVLGDAMGAFASLADSDSVPGGTVPTRVAADALAPRTWCSLVGLDPATPAGALLWRVAAERSTLAGMLDALGSATADRAARRAARNHLAQAQRWDVFGVDAPAPFESGGCSRLDLSGLPRPPTNAVVAGVAGRAYDRAVGDATGSLPWLLLDEAHVAFDGVAAGALRRLVTRGRGPGVSLVAATQRPSGLPPVAISQADLLIVHRLTGRADRDALADARPAFVGGALDERMPSATGEALVIDDATESVHVVDVRQRRTPHDGESPRASERATGSETHE